MDCVAPCPAGSVVLLDKGDELRTFGLEAECCGMADQRGSRGELLDGRGLPVTDRDPVDDGVAEFGEGSVPVAEAPAEDHPRSDAG